MSTSGDSTLPSSDGEELLSRTEIAAAAAAQLRYLKEFRNLAYGVRTEVNTAPVAKKTTARPPQPRSPSKEGGGEQKQELRKTAEAWTPEKKLLYLRDKNVGDCRRCALSKTRNQLVFGRGSATARVMFVGEAPGAEEDRQGEPFVGRAGQRLSLWMQSLGLSEEQVYIANVLKCRPPNNRDPQREEVLKCAPFLRAQIRVIAPKVIVALGRHAGNLLLNQELRLHQMREKIHHYEDAKHNIRVPLLVTYHPSYILRCEGDVENRSHQGTENFKDRKSEDEMARMDLQEAIRVARDS